MSSENWLTIGSGLVTIIGIAVGATFTVWAMNRAAFYSALSSDDDAVKYNSIVHFYKSFWKLGPWASDIYETSERMCALYVSEYLCNFDFYLSNPCPTKEVKPISSNGKFYKPYFLLRREKHVSLTRIDHLSNENYLFSHILAQSHLKRSLLKYLVVDFDREQGVFSSSIAECIDWPKGRFYGYDEYDETSCLDTLIPIYCSSPPQENKKDFTCCKVYASRNGKDLYFFPARMQRQYRRKEKRNDKKIRKNFGKYWLAFSGASQGSAFGRG